MGEHCQPRAGVSSWGGGGGGDSGYVWKPRKRSSKVGEEREKTLTWRERLDSWGWETGEAVRWVSDASIGGGIGGGGGG